MLAVAVVGMLVYSAAGAAPDDGKDLGPAKPSTTKTTSKCEPSTSTTRKDGDKEPTTSTTRKDGDKEPTTSTTEKDSDGKGDSDPAAAKAAAPTGVDLQGAAVATAKDADAGDKATKAAADKDCGSTTTTRKGDGGKDDDDKDDGKGDGDGKVSTTSTTRKRPTTTTTEKDEDKVSTTTTTRQRVEPHTPNPDPGTGGSPGAGASEDPGGTPIEPQEAPPVDAPDSDPGPAAEPEAAADPESVDDEESFDMWDDEEEYVAISPMETPGSGAPLPVFNELVASSSGKASDRDRRDRSRATGGRSRGSERGSGDDTQELAYAPDALTARSLTPTAVVESESARRRLGGSRTSKATESAFPADVISTPADLDLNRRNPLAAGALVLLVGVSRELFKVWRRRATDFWPA